MRRLARKLLLLMCGSDTVGLHTLSVNLFSISEFISRFTSLCFAAYNGKMGSML